MTELQRKALELIETLTILGHDSNDNENTQKLFNSIYMCAHVALGQCKNPHLDWQKRVLADYEEIIK